MMDTDWRPSPCPVCGTMREAAAKTVCQNEGCRVFGMARIKVGAPYHETEVKREAEKALPERIWVGPSGIWYDQPTLPNEVEYVRADMRAAAIRAGAFREAAETARTRHKSWHPGCDVECDVTACTDIHNAILALINTPAPDDLFKDFGAWGSEGTAPAPAPEVTPEQASAKLLLDTLLNAEEHHAWAAAQDVYDRIAEPGSAEESAEVVIAALRAIAGGPANEA